MINAKKPLVVADDFNEMNPQLKKALAKICSDKLKDILAFTFTDQALCSFKEEKGVDKIKIHFDGDFEMTLYFSIEEIIDTTIILSDKPFKDDFANNFERLAKKLRNA